MQHSDEIEIRGLRVLATIGVHAWEQAIRQTLRVTVRLQTNLATAGASDALGDSIDYGSVTETIRRICGEQPHRLIESVASRIADTLLADFAIDGVAVEVEKPGAVVAADTVLVRVQRARQSV